MRIILDTETTGLDPMYDEIIELSIIEAETGAVLHSQRYDTALRVEWPAAEAINGIKPRDVIGLPEIGSDQRIQPLIDQADWIGGWNVGYDLEMLAAVGILPRDGTDIVDVMQMDAELCGWIMPDQAGSRWRKLAVAADWWGYQPPEGMAYHSSVTDCCATRYVYNKILEHYDRKEVDMLLYAATRAHMEEIMRDAGIMQQQMITLMRSGTEHDKMILDEMRHALSAGARYMRAIAHAAQYHDLIVDYKDYKQQVIEELHKW